MTIKSAIQDSLGYVNDQDRATWEQQRRAIEKDKEPSFTKAIVNGVTGSVLDYAQKAAMSKMRAEDEVAAEHRPRTKRRVVEVTEETVSERDRDGREMDF